MVKKPWFLNFRIQINAMQQAEFVTLYGKVVIERNVLFIRNFDVPFTRTNLFRIVYELCFIGVFIMSFFIENAPKKYLHLLAWGILLLSRVTQLYDILFSRSYSNRIPLSRINSVTTSADNSGHHTFVHLHLKNGRYRVIPFRTLEKQHETFIEAITSELATTQLA